MGGNVFIDNICNLYGLKAKIDGVTRIESNTCIDNYLSNIEGKYLVSDICIADHQAIIAEIKTDGSISMNKDQFIYREMKINNWQLFKGGLSSIQIRGESINNKWANLLEDIKTVVEVSFPEKISNNKYIFTMSQGLLKSKDRKNKLLRQYKRGLISKQVYVDYNRIYRKLVWTEQNKKFEEKLINAGGSGKKNGKY